MDCRICGVRGLSGFGPPCSSHWGHVEWGWLTPRRVLVLNCDASCNEVRRGECMCMHPELPKMRVNAGVCM